MKGTIALLLVLPLTGVAGADTLIIPNDSKIETYRENHFPLFPRYEKLQMYEPDTPHSLLKDFRPVVIEPYPQQIIPPEPSAFPWYEQKYGPDSD